MVAHAPVVVKYGMNSTIYPKIVKSVQNAEQISVRTSITGLMIAKNVPGAEKHVKIIIIG